LHTLVLGQKFSDTRGPEASFWWRIFQFCNPWSKLDLGWIGFLTTLQVRFVEMLNMLNLELKFSSFNSDLCS
jgi:hypothetical protein